MKQFGPVSNQWLAEIGVYTVDDVRTIGAVPIYKQLKEMYPDRVSLNLLWGLEAAVCGIDPRELTAADKEVLKAQL